MQISLRRPVRLVWALGGGLLLVLALASCESDRPTRRSRMAPADGAPPATVAARPPMEAHGSFFAGQVDVDVSLNSGGSPWAQGGGGGRGNIGGGRSGGRMSAGMGGSRGGRGGMGGGGGGMRGEGGGGMGTARGSGADATVPSNAPRPVMRESNQPPVQLHLRLTNNGPEPLEVEVLDFNSAIGNFVVQPRKLSVPAGGSVEAEPMTSRLGIPGDAVPLTVRLRTPAGTEQQVLNLQVVRTPAAEPPPAPATTPVPPP